MTSCLGSGEMATLESGSDSPDFTLDVEADKDTWISRMYHSGSDADAPNSLQLGQMATAAHGCFRVWELIR